MSDSYVQQGERKIFVWLSREPMLETFPVNYAQLVRASNQTFSPPDALQGIYALTMLRNTATVAEVSGKPVREKYRIEKTVTLKHNFYGEVGVGYSISDVTDMRSESEFSGALGIVGVPQNMNVNRGQFTGSLKEKTQLHASIAFMNISPVVNAETEGEYLAIRHIESGERLGLNIPGLPVFPAKPLQVGEQWEVTGYTEQKTRYVYPAGTPSTSLAAATLVLMTYQFNGYTDCASKTCAYIEFYGETYEMRDFGGKSNLASLKSVAKTLSRSPMSEVRSYLERREYRSTPGLKGSFQASSKLAGYCLIDIVSRKVILSKLGKEGLTGGGSSLGMIEGSGKGVFREQWILEEKLR